MKKVIIVLISLFLVLIVLSFILVLFKKTLPIGERIAFIRIEGLIIDSKDIIDEFKGYVKDPTVKAIVLRIDSPGGAVAPSQEIYQEVKRAVKKKKILVSMGSVAASGGYYIASPATRIIANPGTLTGSIGVIMEIPNVEGLLNKLGIKTEVVKSGRYKDMASVFRGIKEEEREVLQGVLDNVHEQFIEAVAAGRNMPPEDVKKIADGRIFTGEQALKEGLVDELGNLEDTFKIAAKLTGIKGEPVIISKKERFSFVDIFRNKISKEWANFSPEIKVKYLYTP